ncbi:MAG: HAMP domain-containing histidine kinase [Defluviitaleaceae bacterium]|nr:HAMP domain-containing histidine kinase [Defluviitaleaceae bacterium]
MKKNRAGKKSLQKKMLITIFAIIASSSFLSVMIIARIMPFSPTAFAHIDENLREGIFRVFRLYNAFTVIFAFIFSAAFISFIINKSLKPVRALTEGTKKVAQGDFNVVLETDASRNDELSDLTESFNKMARELSLITMLNNDFINSVSHEFKTPISSIQGFATVLLGSGLTGEQKEYTEIIVNESARLTRLITNILKLSKLENQVIITDKEYFYIDEQIRRSYVLLHNDLSQKKIRVDLDLAQIKYFGNPELIQLIWNNILHNAVKFTGENGQINISCGAAGGEATVSFKDGGIGMDKETAKRVFDKFYQGDKSHSGQGNGLGLSLAGRIAELCGGRIDVISEPGKGSEFTVCLPMK